MEPWQATLLEEWKANNDLVKFYEDLKQKRLSNFLTIQTAFLAVFGLLARDATEDMSMVSLTAFSLIAVPPLVISYYFMRIDVRTRAFVETMRTHLLLIEQEWAARSPDHHFSTYRDTLSVLIEQDPEMTARYVAARGATGDQYARMLKSKSAHNSEHAIMRLFWYVWLVLLGVSVAVHLVWHLLNGSWKVV